MEALNSTNNSNICEFASGGSQLSTWLFVTVLQTIFLTLSLLASLLLNVSFAMVVIVHGTLRRQKDVMLTLVLAILSACNSFVDSIQRFAVVIYGARRLGKQSCYIFGTITICAVLLRFTFVLAITVDRFVIVMYPFQYPRHSTKVAAIIFTVGGLYSVVTPLVFDANVVGCYNLDPSGQICVPQIRCSEIYCYGYNVLQVFIILSFGIVTPTVLNLVMFNKAKKLRTKVACGTVENVEMGERSDREIRSPDVRAIVTVALLLGSIVGLTLPMIIAASIAIVLGLGTTNLTVSLMTLVAGDLYTLTSVADALVVWRNRDVKECAKCLCRRMYKAFKTTCIIKD